MSSKIPSSSPASAWSWPTFSEEQVAQALAALIRLYRVGGDSRPLTALARNGGSEGTLRLGQQEGDFVQAASTPSRRALRKKRRSPRR